MVSGYYSRKLKTKMVLKNRLKDDLNTKGVYGLPFHRGTVFCILVREYTVGDR